MLNFTYTHLCSVHVYSHFLHVFLFSEFLKILPLVLICLMFISHVRIYILGIHVKKKKQLLYYTMNITGLHDSSRTVLQHHDPFIHICADIS